MNGSLIYLHGFLSSPQSIKAQSFKSYLCRYYPNIRLHIPALSFEPEQAIAQINDLIEVSKGSQVGLVGSSLGGYYGLYSGSCYGVPVAMINPALKPYLLLKDYLGENQNLYTQKVYLLEERHMESLLELKVESPRCPENYYVLTQTGDEILDYQEAMIVLPQSPFWIQPGGNHEFAEFDKVIPSIMQFFKARWAETNINRR